MAAIPSALLRGLFRVDGALHVERYNAALGVLGLPPTDRKAFHIDAAGYSPEIAEDRGDPLYLTPGVLRAHALMISVEQLEAPLVHPGLGFAAGAFRAIARGARAEIARVTVREPLIADVRDPEGHPSAAHHLADLTEVELAFRTPGGLLRGAERLEGMKREFLESERRWLDDTFIGEMTELAGEVRDLGSLPAAFSGSTHALGPFYAAAFGGSYVLEEPGASVRTAVTHILCADPPTPSAAPAAEPRSVRGRRVSIEALTPETAATLLESHGIARLDAEALRAEPHPIDEVEHWIAVDHLLAREEPIAGLTPRAVVERMRTVGELPREAIVLDETRRRLRAARTPLDPEALPARLRAHLLQPTSRREGIRRYTRHLRAFVDPAHLGRVWRHAPDVFFTRLPALDSTRRNYFAEWLDRHAPRR